MWLIALACLRYSVKHTAAVKTFAAAEESHIERVSYNLLKNVQ